MALGNVGLAAYFQGDYPTARSSLEEGLALRREVGDKMGFAYLLRLLASVERNWGNYSVASSLYKESLAISKEFGNKHEVAHSLAGLGRVAALTGQPLKGARLLAAAEAHLQAVGGYQLTPVDRALIDIASTRAQLSKEEFEKAYQEGREMSLEQAIKYALEETGD
jgi:tetratricopeptide (TPR) repeat protein